MDLVSLDKIHYHHHRYMRIIDSLDNKKNFFCYASNTMVILAKLGALIQKMILVFFYHVTF